MSETVRVVGVCTAYGAATDTEHGGNFEGTYDDYCEAMAKIANSMIIDDEPTEGSPHLVSSGGMYDIIHNDADGIEIADNLTVNGKVSVNSAAVDDNDVVIKQQLDSGMETVESNLIDRMNTLGINNLLPKASGSLISTTPFSASQKEYVYEDGLIHLEMDYHYNYFQKTIAELSLPSSYYTLLEKNNSDYLIAKGVTSSGITIDLCSELNTPFYYDSSEYVKLQVSIYKEKESSQEESLDIYPALVFSYSDVDAENVECDKYSMLNGDISSELYFNGANNFLGAKNILPSLPATTVTSGDITFTVNDDGSVAVTGSAANSGATLALPFMTLQKGEYILSGGLSSDCFIRLEERRSTSVIYPYYVDTYEKGAIFSNSSTKRMHAIITISKGANIGDGITFYPMLRSKYIEDDTYAPYTMTNRQLTEAVSNFSSNTNYPSGYFIDGNPVYRKVLNLGNLTDYGLTYDGTEQAVSVGFSIPYSGIPDGKNFRSLIKCTVNSTVLVPGDEYFPSEIRSFSGNTYFSNTEKVISYLSVTTLGGNLSAHIKIGSGFLSSTAESYNNFNLIIEYSAAY